jgi:hypothetical protein
VPVSILIILTSALIAHPKLAEIKDEISEISAKFFTYWLRSSMWVLMWLFENFLAVREAVLGSSLCACPNS